MTIHESFTRQQFLAAYRDVIEVVYGEADPASGKVGWAKDKAKLDRYMQTVEDTIAGKSSRWMCDGNALVIAWRELGGRNKPTLLKLRALTVEGA